LLVKFLQTAAYFILDDQRIQSLFKQSLTYLQGKTLSPVHLDIVTALLNYFPKEETEETEITLIVRLLIEDDKSEEFMRSAFTFLVLETERFGATKFRDFLSEAKVDFDAFLLGFVAHAKKEKPRPIAVINLLAIVRKTVAGDLVKEKGAVIAGILDLCREYALRY